MKKKNFLFKTATTMLLLTNGALMNINAQVSIVDNKALETFSVLELISGNNKGLRLPQMTTKQRKTMQETATFQAKATNEAMGLQIFNTTTYCVETWNGSTWIAACMNCNGIIFLVLNGS